MSGNELAVMSRNGYFSPAQSPSMEVDTKFYESEYPSQEPAMKRAVEVRLLACMLEQKYDAVGSLRTITPQSAKRIAAGIVNSGKAKALDKMPAQFVHIAVDHGTVTLPTEFPMMKMDVQRNNDGEWVCPILSSQVQIELARKTSGR